MDMHAGARALVLYTFDGDETMWDRIEDTDKEQVYTAVRAVVQAVMSGKPPVTTDDIENLRQRLYEARDAEAGVVKYNRLNEAIGIVNRIQGRVTAS